MECQTAAWDRHGYNCVPVMVTEIEGKGRGLVTGRDFKMGEGSYVDKLVIEINESESDLESWP